MFIPYRDDNPTRRAPVVTLLIIVLNTAALVWMSQLGPRQQVLATHTWGFMPARLGQLFDHRPVVFQVPEMVRDPWGIVGVREQAYRVEPHPLQVILSLFSCMFLHGGWMHLLGNMWFLWIFGNNVEDRLGHGVYLLFYLAGGLSASACHWLNDPGSVVPVVGASGAGAAVLGAYAITWPWARVHTLVFLLIFFTVMDFPALLVLGVWFLTQLLEATKSTNLGMSGGVAWWAHVGGFAAGAALMPALSALVGADGLPRHHDTDPLEPQDEF